METEIISRQALYEMVWSEPMLTLSKRYLISDTGLRKACTRMNIPLPKAGHWQKINFGKNPKKLALPEEYTGEIQITLRLRDEQTQNISGTSPASLLQAEIEDHLKDKLVVPDRLTRPDKLIMAASESLNKKDKYVTNGMVFTGRDIIDIRVTPPNIARALRIMDTLIKALHERGHSIHVKNQNTYAHVMEEDFKINLRETSKREIIKDKYNWDRSIYHPTGILSFQLHGYHSREWKDGKVTLEKQLSKIITKLELVGLEWKQWRMEANKNEEIRKEKERIEKDFEMLRQKELSDVRELLNKSVSWHKAVNLRNYIDEVEKNNSSPEAKKWIEWARKKADWYDPFIENPDDLLNDVDKETLCYKNKGF